MKHEPIGDHAERKRVLALIERCEKEQKMSDRKRCCCNCRRNIRNFDEGGMCYCHCEIDGHYIGYVECFEGWCRRWAKDKWQTEKGERE